MPPRRKSTRQTRVKSPDHAPAKDEKPTTDQANFDVTTSEGSKPVSCQRYGPSNGSPSLIFTHGASGGLANPAMRAFAGGFCEKTPVVCFKGSMNLQSRVKAFHTVIDDQNANTATLGGRSMGARAAVLAAKEHQTKTIILVSYPLIGKNGGIRDQILLDVDKGIDVLFVSGDKDNMCNLQQLHEVQKKMKAKSWLITVQGADHGMSLSPKNAVDEVRQYTGKLAYQWSMERDSACNGLWLTWDAESSRVVDSGWEETAPGPDKNRTSSQGTNRAHTADKSERPAKRRKK